MLAAGRGSRLHQTASCQRHSTHYSDPATTQHHLHLGVLATVVVLVYGEGRVLGMNLCSWHKQTKISYLQQ